MKTATEILTEMVEVMPITLVNLIRIMPYLVEAIEISQIDAYNQALEDAANTCEDNCVVDEIGEYTDETISVTYKESILKLKK